MNKKILSYGDAQTTAIMWLKAIMLVPIWGLALIPVVGGISALLGSLCVQVGYTLIILSCLIYLGEDILKRRITIDTNTIFFGYRHFNLANLISIGLTYHGNRPLPDKLVMNFRHGRKLVLALGRLRGDGVDSLLGIIDTRLPECQVDPVLRTLTRGKRLVRDTSLDSEDLVEVPYASRLLFKQLLDVFLNSASRWMRVGPVLTCIVAAPVWLLLTRTLYTSAIPSMRDWYVKNQLAVNNFLDGRSQDLDLQLGKWISHITENTMNAVANPVGATVAWIAFAFSMFYFARFLLRPNVILMDENGLKLCQRLPIFTYPLEQIQWKNLTLLSFGRSAASGDPNQWNILLYASNRKEPVRLSLGAIAMEHRTKFLKAIQRWAPQAEINSELAETLLPRQERSYTELWLQSLASPPERKSLEPLQSHQQLQNGRYEVVYRLGVGGQGRAYLCWENAGTMGNHSQEVVLKETILPVFVQNSVRQQALERFQQEAIMLESLNSARIVRLLDYFIEDHRGYLVLEHVDGHNLRQIVQRDGPMPEDDVLELAEQMAEILAYLHEKAVMHRDFTPDNLISGRNRQLKLIDFNVAQSAKVGATGTIVGKHAYVPPEQFRGKPNLQSDIYAFGATLFYLVTGQEPEPISESDPRIVNTHISRQFAALVADCTKLNCNKRIGDANQLLGRIKRMLGKESDRLGTLADDVHGAGDDQSIIGKEKTIVGSIAGDCAIEQAIKQEDDIPIVITLASSDTISIGKKREIIEEVVSGG